MSIARALGAKVGPYPVSSAYFDGDLATLRHAFDTAKSSPGALDRLIVLLNAGNFAGAERLINGP